MARLSITIKLLASITSVIVLSLLLTSVAGIRTMQQTGAQTKQFASDSLTQSVTTQLQQQADKAALQVATRLNQAFSITQSLTQLMANSSIHSGGTPFSREQVKRITHDLLQANPALSAAYTEYEANGYDDNDEQYTGQDFAHSHASGVLQTYWGREGNTLVHYQEEDLNARYSDAVDEFGQREAEWYLCSRDTMRPCTIEPYLYELPNGQQVLMTTLAAPVIAGGHFRGLVGIDIYLTNLQKMAAAIAADIGTGAEVHLVSAQQRLVASTTHNDRLNRPLAEADEELATQLRNHTLTEDSRYVSAAATVHISASNTGWQIIIRQPRAVATAPLTALTERLDQGLTAARSQMFSTSAAATAASLLLLALLLNSILKPIAHMTQQFTALASSDGDLTQKMVASSHRELNEMAGSFNAFTDKLQAMIRALQTQSHALDRKSQQLSLTASVTRSATHRQNSETSSIAAAIEEMSATSSEVAALAEQVATSATESYRYLQHTQQTMQGTVTEVQALSVEMSTMADQITQVAHRSSSINGILETIGSIVEQTNLLALNAAIEAARAGEQGRGFAVVADEVRNLAARTQDSTTEIHTLIQNLQTDVAQAVTGIKQGKQRVDHTVETSEQSYRQLDEVTSKLNTITASVTQVATAAEEQSSVSTELSRHVSGIEAAATELSAHALEVDEVSQDLAQVVNELNHNLKTLKA